MNARILALAIVTVFLVSCSSGGTGRAVFLITDAAADMGAVTKVEVTVDSVSAHSSESGWVTVTDAPQTYDLLALKAEGQTSLLADVQLKEGTYQQVRLMISKVMVTDDEGTHEAKLPSGDLKIVTDLVVAANTTAAITFDFLADESLHTTGSGGYVLAPVIQVETRDDAEVDASDEDDVKVEGAVKSKIAVGMDASGNVGEGLNIEADDELAVEGGSVKVKGKLNAEI